MHGVTNTRKPKSQSIRNDIQELDSESTRIDARLKTLPIISFSRCQRYRKSSVFHLRFFEAAKRSNRCAAFANTILLIIAVTVGVSITSSCNSPANAPSLKKNSRDAQKGPGEDPIEKNIPGYTGLLVSASQVVPSEFENWHTRASSIVLQLTTPENAVDEIAAAIAIQNAGFELEYFIEVGRSPELAEQHPQWMASLQGHPEWRRLFPDFPEPGPNQVVKNHPWVPILYRESFVAHADRIRDLLHDKPKAKRIWLNDLQGAPSACGCGHPLCRWTADYGPIKTATPLDHNAAAEFVAAVSEFSPDSQIVPIFVSECEQADQDNVCCGVSCFEGKCWSEFTLQIDTVAAAVPQFGVACFYRAFNRDLTRYGKEAAWVEASLKSFSEIPRLRSGTGVPPERLIAVLQGWDVTDSQIQAQQTHAIRAGAAGWLLSLTPIEQSWQPVMFDLPEPTK